MKSKIKLPHEDVYARLGPSRRHGVGVFAIRNIKRGTKIFPDDPAKLLTVRASQIRKLPRELRELYEDFPVILKNGRTYLCPRSFNLLTVSWYINQSKKPNIVCDHKYDFFAKKDIRIGEELTVDYDTYNQF